MPDGRIRALCAKIALELDPIRAEALIKELKGLIFAEYLDQSATATEDRSKPKPN
jgi:ribosomal protein L12E/L44/L45/RPP1/RPP2